MPRSSWQEDVEEIIKDETQPGQLLDPARVIDNPHHDFEARVLEWLEGIDKSLLGIIEALQMIAAKLDKPDE